jgi:hypothetical protein
VDISAEEALAATKPNKDRTGASMFLMDMLASGPVAKTLIDERAARHGLSEDQLKRAKKKMGVDDFKDGFQGPWFWCLPQHNPTQAEGKQENG